MAFDAFFLRAVLGEIREKATHARVDKIHQPSRDTVILQLKGSEGRYKLLLAPNPAAPRLHLTTASPENPAEPPMFCMLLRKHLLGARLSDIFQLPMERCAVFSFDCTDEMGYPVQKKLVAELMGRTCNLYLLGSDGRIIDCLRRIGLDETSKRPALPGLMYQLPDPITKLDPLPPLEGRWQPERADGGVFSVHFTPQSPSATAPLKGSLWFIPRLRYTL
jgi:predicted ribosome quality control (RQC) complex YloA/Tae2 family protein